MNGPGSAGGSPLRIADRLASGASWIMAGRVVILTLMVLSTVLLARLLDPEAFGIAAIATTFAAIANLATQLSLANALVQQRNITQGHIDTAFTLNLIRGIAIAALLAGLALPVAWLYGDDRLIPLMFTLAASTGFSGLVSPNLALLSRKLIFWPEAAQNFAERGTYAIMAVLLAFLFGSYWAIVLGLAAGHVALVFSSYVIAPYRPRLSFSKLSDILSFSVWLSLGQGLNTLIWRMEYLIVGYVLGNAKLGILTVATRLAQAPTLEVIQPIYKAAFPGFSKINNDTEALKAAYQRVQTLALMLALPAGCGLALVSEPLVLVALGERWSGAIPVLQLLSGALALQTLASSGVPLAMSMGRTKLLFTRDIYVMSVRVPLILIGLYAGGLIGLLIGRLISSVWSTFVNLIIVKRLLTLSINEQLRNNARTGLATAGMAVALLTADALYGPAEGSALALKLVMQVLLGMVVYASLILILWLCSGRPKSAETEFINLAWSVLRRILAMLTRKRGGGATL